MSSFEAQGQSVATALERSSDGQKGVLILNVIASNQGQESSKRKTKILKDDSLLFLVNRLTIVFRFSAFVCFLVSSCFYWYTTQVLTYSRRLSSKKEMLWVAIWRRTSDTLPRRLWSAPPFLTAHSLTLIVHDLIQDHTGCNVQIY